MKSSHQRPTQSVVPVVMLVVFVLLVLRLVVLGLMMLVRPAAGHEPVAAVAPVVITLYAPVAVGSAARLQCQSRSGPEKRYDECEQQAAKVALHITDI